MRAPRNVFIGVGVLAVVATACDGLLSIHVLDATGSDASSAQPFGSSACAACAAQQCPVASGECTKDIDFCGPYEGCLAGCDGGAACRSQCTMDFPPPSSGSSAISPLSACLTSKCATECGLTCGGFSAYLSEPGAAPSCEGCIGVHACSDALACASSADCDAYWRCYMACPTPDCKSACASDHEAGAALFGPLQGDYQGTCSSDCAFGNYWACVGKINWPSTSVTQVRFTIPVVDILTQYPSPGENVAICTDCPCNPPTTSPLGTGTTNDAGIATVQVDNVRTNTGVGLIGCAEVTSPTDASVPFFGYWGYPLSAPVEDPRQGAGYYGKNVAAESLQVFTPAEVTALAASIDGGLLPGRGFIGAAVFDCLANPSPGARVSIDSGDPFVTTYYPAPGATATSLDGLVGGAGFLLNVPPGRYDVSAMPGPLDGGVSSVQTVHVEPGTTTAGGMFPTPGR